MGSLPWRKALASAEHHCERQQELMSVLVCLCGSQLVLGLPRSASIFPSDFLSSISGEPDLTVTVNFLSQFSSAK